MTTNQIINIQNPVPILQQERSSITTNPFIPNEQKTLELETLDKEANTIMERAWVKSKSNSIKNLSLNDINQNVSSSFIGLIDDLFTKPKETPWKEYIVEIFNKDQRYTYIGILFILIAVYISFIK